MLTELPREEIEALDAARAEDAAARASQTCLAEELTRLVHGDAGLTAARRATEIFFGAEIADLDDAQLGQIFADVPSETVVARTCYPTRAGCRSSTPWSSAGLAKSKGEARRTVEQGGAYVNNRRVAGVDDPADRRRPGQRKRDGSANGQEKVRFAAVRVGLPTGLWATCDPRARHL